MNALETLSDAELRAILMTCDGRGKDVKAQALEILLERARQTRP